MIKRLYQYISNMNPDTTIESVDRELNGYLEDGWSIFHIGTTTERDEHGNDAYVIQIITLQKSDDDSPQNLVAKESFKPPYTGGMSFSQRQAWQESEDDSVEDGNVSLIGYDFHERSVMSAHLKLSDVHGILDRGDDDIS